MTDRVRNAQRVSATYASDKHAASLATSAWLAARGYIVPPGFKWDVAIALDVVERRATTDFDGKTDTRFHLSITPNEWGFFFCHKGLVSWIRVTDVVTVQDRDEHDLFPSVPPLRDVGMLVQTLEDRFRIRFHRKHASIRTSIVGAEDSLRTWVAAAL